MNKLLFIPAVALTGSLISGATLADLDSDSATVNVSVGLYASLTGLDDFTLSTTDADGSATAVYTGSDDFNLESNSQVRVNLSGSNLSNGSDSISTNYAISTSVLMHDAETLVLGGLLQRKRKNKESNGDRYPLGRNCRAYETRSIRLAC